MAKEKDYKKIVLEIDNAMQRWFLGRDNDDETLKLINKIMLENGMLLWENGQSALTLPTIEQTKKKCYNPDVAESCCVHPSEEEYCNGCDDWK